MKQHKNLIYFIGGIILGISISLVYLLCFSENSKGKNTEDLPNNEKQSEVEGYISSTYSDDLLNIKSLSKEEEELYIKFDESLFTIKSGENFHYWDSIVDTKGKIDEINAVEYKLTPSRYLVHYTVRNKNDQTIKRDYNKLLIVI